MGLLYLGVDGMQPPAASLHLTQADWQVADAPGFSAPPLALDSNALPGTWRQVVLPLALPIALLRQANTDTHATINAT
eukprot:gene19122-24193_t